MRITSSELVETVRRADDAWLENLLTERSDLARPVPPSLTALAHRAGTRGSVARALSRLPLPVLSVLEAAVVLTGGGGRTSAAALTAAVGAVADAGVARLRALALLLGDAADLAPAPEVAEAIGPTPLGLGPTLREIGARYDDGWPTTPAALRSIMAEAPDGARTLLGALAWGPPVGTLGEQVPPAARWLLEHHVLHRPSPAEVLLPREVALAARGDRLAKEVAAAPPLPQASVRDPDVVSAEVVAASDAIVRQVEQLVGLWSTGPAAALRAGGLAAREVKQLAVALGVEVARASLVVEVAGMLDLLGVVQHEEATLWAPTPRADAWLERDSQTRWAEICLAWAGSARVPWLVGSRTDKGVLRAALSPDLHRAWAPPLRRRCLEALAAWPPGSAPSHDQVRAHLAWWTPRSVPPAATVTAVLAEAEAIGLVGAGALGEPARVLLAPEVTAAGVAASLEAQRPAPVADLIVQGDLTGVVPGRPTPELADLLAASADVDSRGAALTVRFSAASIGRALEAGWSTDDLLTRLRGASIAPLPQPLEYLVAEASRTRRHVRVQPAAAVVMTDDEASLLALLSDPRLAPLGLRRTGPTTLASDVGPLAVSEAMRGAGAAPVLEGPDGRPVRLRPTQVRAARPAPLGGPPVEGAASVAAAAAAMRKGEQRAAAQLDGAVETPSTTDELELLRAAADRGTEVRVVVAGSGGATQERVVRPLSVDGGRVRALDAAREAEITVATHRIVSVHPV